MDLKDIKKILYQEKEKEIKKLPPNFYSDSLKYISHLKKKLEEINKENILLYNIINNELLGVQKDINTIFIRRTEKIILRCISEVLIGSNSFKNEYEMLLTNEKKFYDNLSFNINNLKKELIQNNLINQSIIYNKNNTQNEEQNKKMLKYSIIRILKDIPKFIGENNKVYNLFFGDIITIPSSNAKILISNNVAIYIKNNN